MLLSQIKELDEQPDSVFLRVKEDAINKKTLQKGPQQKQKYSTRPLQVDHGSDTSEPLVARRRSCLP
jgi:hypothetical protein